MPDDLYTRYGERLDALDEAIFLAEKSGNLGERITLLRERSSLWFELAAELRLMRKDATGASLGGQRDLANASMLARDAI
jgi:hypothetical protein